MGWAALIAAIVGLGVKGYQAYKSSEDEDVAQKRLNQVNGQPLARYTLNPALRRFQSQAAGEAASPQGFSGAETNAFQQKTAQVLATRMGAAKGQVGGGKIASLMNVGDTIKANNDFAMNDATLRRSNRLGAIGRGMNIGMTEQGLENNNTGTDIGRRNMIEQLLGNAISSQKAFRQNMWSSMGDDLIGAGTYGALSNMGGGKSKTDPNVDFNTDGGAYNNYRLPASRRFDNSFNSEWTPENQDLAFINRRQFRNTNRFGQNYDFNK